MNLKEKVTIITGAAQGIGLACAERFIKEGAKVILHKVQKPEQFGVAKINNLNKS